uniref:Sugar phosphate transporter domain-containing protein n=1 Tax=Lotharella globosa TaxID=91324 RepID=A0A7S3ZAN3_9EUKA|mmetsp:Transcript_24693/g.48220  ORF Transcript_24693/g.48220 Transcript_24693/m.48220 type:complete len:361 (+) Transcript_24693:145-1227(+)
MSKDKQVAKKDNSGCLYTLAVIALLVVCCGESVGFSVFNKYIFSGPLQAPIFVTATHQLFCFMGACIIWGLSPRSFYTRTKIDSPAAWTKIMLIPLMFCMNIGMNNLSLQFTTLALNQLIRSFSPVAIALTSFLIEGKTQSMPKALSLTALVGGVIMGVSSSPDFELLGFLICAGSVFGQAMGIVMTAFVMGGTSVKLHVFDVLLYATLPSLIILLPWSYAMGEFDVLRNEIASEGFGPVLGLICAGGSLAFTYNLFCTIFIKMTSSVYYGVTGGFRCALAIVISFFIFPQKITFMGIAGIVVAMSAFVANSFFTMKEKLASQKKITASDDVEARAAEKERLLEAEDADYEVTKPQKIIK